ncbi:MAG: hypothetical protein NTW87_16800 [Planctomycetota bacterium]|nr:hypothetical protein [Planctomycetota bacterium]
MNLNALKWRQAVIEVRYPTTYRAFDHAGELADQIIQAMPNWEMKQATPNALELVRPMYGLSAFVGVDTVRVAQVQTDEYYDLEELKHFTADYLGIVGAALSIYRVNEFTRIGYRTMHNYALGTQDEATRAWAELPFFKVTLPKEAPEESKPGAVVLNLRVGDDLGLRFEVSNLAVEVGLGGRQIDWTHRKIYRLPSEQQQRKAEFDAMKMAERKFKFLPKFGLEVDLDWFREDWAKAKPEDVGKFITECDAQRAKLIPLLLGVRK